VLAIAGGKGGCGKTTTTLGLASALARRDRRVIAVDADVDMPNLHVEADTAEAPGVDAVADGTPLEDAVRRSVTFHGVDVLAAPSDTRTLESVLERLRSRPEHVLIDTPAGAAADVCGPLSTVDRAILVTTPSRESVLAATKTAALARTLDSSPIGTVVTRSDGTVDPAPLLSCPTLCHVPAVSSPTQNRRIQASYADCVSALAERNV
jgi:septum site-determining protein MinD